MANVTGTHAGENMHMDENNPGGYPVDLEEEHHGVYPATDLGAAAAEAAGHATPAAAGAIPPDRAEAAGALPPAGRDNRRPFYSARREDNSPPVARSGKEAMNYQRLMRDWNRLNPRGLIPGHPETLPSSLRPPS